MPNDFENRWFPQENRTQHGAAAVHEFVLSRKGSWRHLPGAGIVVIVLIFLLCIMVVGSWIYQLLCLLLFVPYVILLAETRRRARPARIEVDSKALKVFFGRSPAMLFELNNCFVQTLRWPSGPRFLFTNAEGQCILSPEDFETPEELRLVFDQWKEQVEQQARTRFADQTAFAAGNQRLEKSRRKARRGSAIFMIACVLLGALFQSQHMPGDAAKMFALAAVSCLILSASWLIQRVQGDRPRQGKS